MKIKEGLLVAIGGAAGASLRYLTDLWFLSSTEDGKLYSLFLENTIGSFLLGLFTSWFLLKSKNKRFQLLLGTGLCGSYTTMSSFASVSDHLLKHPQNMVISFLYVSFSVLLGIAAGGIGLYLGSMDRRRGEMQ